MTPGVFVTGTDTGVGKTAVAAGLIEALRAQDVDARPLKPVETGAPAESDWPEDAAILAEAAGLADAEPSTVCPVRFEEPLAPSVAARRAGRPIDLATLDAAVEQVQAEAELALVEGAGGLLVPVTEDATMADLAARWQLPVLIVARSGLGTLNHTALTVETARAHGLDVLGVVLNRWPTSPDVATRTNPAELERLTGAPVLGRLPELPDVDTADGRRTGLHEATASRIDLQPLLDLTDRSRPHAQA